MDNCKTPTSGLASAKTLAAYFEVAPVTIWRWTKQGKLTAIRLSDNCTRFEWSEATALHALKTQGA